MNHLKTIIIDDSKAIQEELKLLLTEFPQIVFAGEASNIQQAVKLVESIKPDLIFLDNCWKRNCQWFVRGSNPSWLT